MDTTFTIGSASAGAVGMTLAAMAYAPDRGAIEQLLADPALATKGRWTLVWFACDDANQVFIARDTVTGQQAVVIRGSVTDPREAAFWLDWFDQDLSVFRTADSARSARLGPLCGRENEYKIRVPGRIAVQLNLEALDRVSMSGG